MAGQIQRTSGKRNKTFHENIFFGRLEVFNGGASGFCSVSFPNWFVGARQLAPILFWPAIGRWTRSGNRAGKTG